MNKFITQSRKGLSILALKLANDTGFFNLGKTFGRNSISKE